MPEDQKDVPDAVTEDIGGVQGEKREESEAAPASPSTPTGTPPDQPAPDAGEIEWTGGIIRKPPAPQKMIVT